ncbi:hypothetical protein Trydic_g18527, partial [Trypoxylus dichotomus]
SDFFPSLAYQLSILIGGLAAISSPPPPPFPIRPCPRPVSSTVFRHVRRCERVHSVPEGCKKWKVCERRRLGRWERTRERGGNLRGGVAKTEKG